MWRCCIRHDQIVEIDVDQSHIRETNVHQSKGQEYPIELHWARVSSHQQTMRSRRWSLQLERRLDEIRSRSHDADQSIHQGDFRVFSVKNRMINWTSPPFDHGVAAVVENVSFDGGGGGGEWRQRSQWKASARKREGEGSVRSTYLRWPVLNLEMSPYLATCWVPVQPDRTPIHYLDTWILVRRGANFESSSFFFFFSLSKKIQIDSPEGFLLKFKKFS